MSRFSQPSQSAEDRQPEPSCSQKSRRSAAGGRSVAALPRPSQRPQIASTTCCVISFGCYGPSWGFSHCGAARGRTTQRRTRSSLPFLRAGLPSHAHRSRASQILQCNHMHRSLCRRSLSFARLPRQGTEILEPHETISVDGIFGVGMKIQTNPPFAVQKLIDAKDPAGIKIETDRLPVGDLLIGVDGRDITKVRPS